MTTVIDLAYGHTRIADRPGPDVTVLLNAIDADAIVVHGRAAPAEHRWAELFDAFATAAGPGPLIVGHPSTWGGIRRAILVRAAALVAADVRLVPRAILIARSHADLTVSRCAVVETTHRPDYPAEHPRRAPVWDVQILCRGAGDWEIERSGVLEPDGDPGVDGPAVEALVDDRVEAVFVAGSDDDEVARAVDLVSEFGVAGRVSAIDPGLIARWGARATRRRPVGDPAALFAGLPDPVPTRPGRSRLLRWGLPVVALVAVIIAAAMIGGRHPTSPRPGSHQVVVGRTTLLVPTGWRRSDPPADSGGPGQTRTVFASTDDGSRLLVIQSPVRADSTLASVAVSLRNRIAQRGEDVVAEFSASTRFGGRDVISYREIPVSGSAIRWYVLVEKDLQVSVGCQVGTGGDAIDGPCADAVRTAVIAPG
ncbi:MAG: type VII secretion-associated protein [Gordonia sp. (in: high G+C Gram-positive bacteria)]